MSGPRAEELEPLPGFEPPPMPVIAQKDTVKEDAGEVRTIESTDGVLFHLTVRKGVVEATALLNLYEMAKSDLTDVEGYLFERLGEQLPAGHMAMVRELVEKVKSWGRPLAAFSPLPTVESDASASARAAPVGRGRGKSSATAPSHRRKAAPATRPSAKAAPGRKGAGTSVRAAQKRKSTTRGR